MMDDSGEKKLSALREKIDKLDGQILNLLNKRAECAIKAAQLKRDKDHTGSLYRPEREAAVIDRILRLHKRSGGPLKEDQARLLFREIMSVCLALEESVKIGYLGPETTFTHEAALQHFGKAAMMRSYRSIDQVFRALADKNIAFGVVPVENSRGGTIGRTLDLLVDSSLKIVGEVELRIRHNLLSRCKRLKDLRFVYSHEQGLTQCRLWLAENLPDCEQIPVSSTAEAAKRADDANAAAIASVATAARLNIAVVEEDIQDDPCNVTRFLVLGDGDLATDPSGRDKTSIVVSARNRPGALLRLIRPLSDKRVSMMRIESRPSRRKAWEYFFFIDMEGHCRDAPLHDALHELQKEAQLFRLLGSYPQASGKS